VQSNIIGILDYSTTKTGRHDIAESGVKTPKINHDIYGVLK
jgi:hypothetical protein